MDERSETSREVLVGRVRKPVGLRGEVVVEPTGGDRARFSPGRRLFVEGEPLREVVILASRPVRKRAVAVLFEGFDSIEAAETLRNKLLYVEPEELPPLPPGVYYDYQLTGLEVIDADGVSLGRVESILQTGSNDVYCVGKGQAEILIPAVPDYVARVDLAQGRIELAVPRSALGESDPPV